MSAAVFVPAHSLPHRTPLELLGLARRGLVEARSLDSCAASYAAAHLAALRGAGMHNYSIFRDGDKLFAYLEVDDLAQMQQALAGDATNARWQAYMRDLISIEADPETGFARLLPEMFHME